MTQTSGRNRNSSPLPFGGSTLLIAAASLIAYGLSRRSKAGTALATAGGVLAFTAAKSVARSSKSTAKSTFLVNASPEQAYALWRNFGSCHASWPTSNPSAVLDGNRSEWVAPAPGQRESVGLRRSRRTQPNQRIAWRSLPDSELKQAVRSTSAPTRRVAAPLSAPTCSTPSRRLLGPASLHSSASTRSSWSARMFAASSNCSKPARCPHRAVRHTAHAAFTATPSRFSSAKRPTMPEPQAVRPILTARDAHRLNAHGTARPSTERSLR